MKPQAPYTRTHRQVKGERVGIKEPNTNLGLAEMRRRCNEFFKSRGMPEKAYGDYYADKPNKTETP